MSGCDRLLGAGHPTGMLATGRPRYVPWPDARGLEHNPSFAVGETAAPRCRGSASRGHVSTPPAETGTPTSGDLNQSPDVGVDVAGVVTSDTSARHCRRIA